MKPNDVVSNCQITRHEYNASVDAAQQEQQPGLDFVRQLPMIGRRSYCKKL
jgi:glutaminyl-tRNA synthetase